MYDFAFQKAYENLSRDPKGLRRRALRALRGALSDSNAWSSDGKIPNRRWLLAELGFPEDLKKPKSTVRMYWRRLCNAGIVDDEWRFKAALILAALEKDPFPWIQERLWSGSSVLEIASEIGMLLSKREAEVSLTGSTVLTLVRYGFEKQALTLSPLLWELALRDLPAVKLRVSALMVRALDDEKFWQHTGSLKGYLFFEELGLPAKTSKRTKEKFRKRLVALGAFPWICRYKVAFVLYALGIEDLSTWFRDNSTGISVEKNLCLRVNELLAEGGFKLRIRSAEGFIDAIRILDRHPNSVEVTGECFKTVANGLQQAVRLALNDDRFRAGGTLQRHMVLQAAAGEEMSLPQLAKVWEELLNRKVIPPTCNYAPGLVLWALDIDAIRWIRANYVPGEYGSLTQVSRKINGILAQEGYSFRLGGTANTLHRMIHYLICQGAL